MKIISHQRNITSSIRITLSFAILITQFLIPISNNCIAANSSEPGVVQTPEIQETNQPIMLPFLPGDAILLNAYPDTSSFLNGVYAIDSQGYIEFPIGERIYISGMNEDQFIKYLKDKYQNYMVSPNLSVKPLIRVAVVGGFLMPGLYYVDNKMSLWDLIRRAGGPSHEGAIKEINWERNGEKMIEDMAPYLERGVSLRSMGFQSGDLIWAPSPQAEDTWDIVTTRVLPIAAFATSVYLMWISYQTLILIAQGRR